MLRLVCIQTSPLPMALYTHCGPGGSPQHASSLPGLHDLQVMHSAMLKRGTGKAQMCRTRLRTFEQAGQLLVC